MFIGRTKELALLGRFTGEAEDGKRLFVVKGRKGIGKTALLREVLKDKSSAFLTAFSTTGPNEVAIFAAELGLPGITSLAGIFDAVTARAGSQEFTLVIDNYPAFAKADGTFEDVLYDYITRVWAGTRISVIIAGDAFLAMEKALKDGRGRMSRQLYGEITLQPLAFYEVRSMLPGMAAEDQALVYGLTGGIPAQIARLAKALGGETGAGLFAAAVKALFLSDTAGGNLPEDVLEIDLREKSYYNCLLTTLAGGRSRVYDISAAVGKPKDVVVPYMNTLIAISVVEKEHPVTEPTNRRKTRYKIVNSYDIFWYRYIAPHMDYVYSGQTDRLIDEVIVPQADAFMHMIFIRLCREFIANGGAKLPVTIENVGSWWENDDENHTSEGFDLVASATAGEEKEALVFGRCFLDTSPVDMGRLKGLIDLTKRVREKADETYYIAFSNSGFNDTAITAAGAIRNILLISMDEIVAGRLKQEGPSSE